MTDEPMQGREICFPRLFPWLRLFRGIGISIDPKKLFLAALGLVALNTGWGLLDRAFPNTDPRIPASLSSYAVTTDLERAGIASDLGLALWHLTEPVQCLVRPFLTAFSLKTDGLSLVHVALVAAWGALVWGIVGGAIARVAMIQIACGERIGVRKALEFALGKAIPLVLGPLSPLLGIAIVTAPLLLFGLLYRLPASIGPVIAGLLLILPLLAGLVMSMILVGLAAGWPLMHASVAAEAEDGFDALSRSYAYVFQRPMRYAAYWALAWLIGLVGIIFVSVFANLVVHMAQWGLSISATTGHLDPFFRPSGVAPASAAGKAHAFWITVVRLLANAWIYSYFWTAASLIYLTIRQDVDETDWRQVWLPPAPPHPLMPDIEVVDALIEANARATEPSV